MVAYFKCVLSVVFGLGNKSYISACFHGESGLKMVHGAFELALLYFMNMAYFDLSATARCLPKHPRGGL